MEIQKWNRNWYSSNQKKLFCINGCQLIFSIVSNIDFENIVFKSFILVMTIIMFFHVKTL